MNEAQVREFVTNEAFQGEQLAQNMWTRTLTTSPQITSYFLGYDQVKTLYEDVRQARGSAFVLHRFMDGMMEMGPVPVSEYRKRLLPPRKLGRRGRAAAALLPSTREAFRFVQAGKRIEVQVIDLSWSWATSSSAFRLTSYSISPRILSFAACRL